MDQAIVAGFRSPVSVVSEKAMTDGALITCSRLVDNQISECFHSSEKLTEI